MHGSKFQCNILPRSTSHLQNRWIYLLKSTSFRRIRRQRISFCVDTATFIPRARKLRLLVLAFDNFFPYTTYRETDVAINDSCTYVHIVYLLGNKLGIFQMNKLNFCCCFVIFLLSCGNVPN